LGFISFQVYAPLFTNTTPECRAFASWFIGHVCKTPESLKALREQVKLDVIRQVFDVSTMDDSNDKSDVIKCSNCVLRHKRIATMYIPDL
jgi:hypothetical protein